MKIILFLFHLIQLLPFIACFEPITFGSLVYYGATILAGGIITNIALQSQEQIVKVARRTCQYVGYCEGCEDRWIPGNMDGLQMDLQSMVFGQNLAIETILISLKHHFKKQRERKPTKALVLSFHGTPGVGKNYISQLILKNLFKLGGNTNYVHFFRGSIDFPVSKNIGEYRDMIADIVKSKVEDCNRSVFVFDEVDKMPASVLNVLRPFLDYDAVFNGIDYRNTIFIFLSNLGGAKITEKAIEFWEQGISREEYDMEVFDTIIRQSVTKEKGGFYVSDLLKYHVIDHCIPFLPLEKQHIRECLVTEVSKMGQIMSEELFNEVISLITFTPEPHEIFASSGCKLIAEKIDFLIERAIYRKRRNSM